MTAHPPPLSNNSSDGDPMTLPFRAPTHHSEWQARAIGRNLTPAEIALVEVMAGAGLPPHHGGLGPLRSEGTYVASRTVRTDLATWDAGHLTRLVFAAHDACARVSVSPAGFCVRVSLHLRSTEPGDLPIANGHPTLEDAVSSWRAAHPARKATP